ASLGNCLENLIFSTGGGAERVNIHSEGSRELPHPVTRGRPAHTDHAASVSMSRLIRLDLHADSCWRRYGQISSVRANLRSCFPQKSGYRTVKGEKFNGWRVIVKCRKCPAACGLARI